MPTRRYSVSQRRPEGTVCLHVHRDCALGLAGTMITYRAPTGYWGPVVSSWHRDGDHLGEYTRTVCRALAWEGPTLLAERAYLIRIIRREARRALRRAGE